MGEAHTIAERLAAGPAQALGLIKRALLASPGNSLDAQLDLERDLQREAGASDDYAEGVRAFLEKRPADFLGKRERRMTPQEIARTSAETWADASTLATRGRTASGNADEASAQKPNVARRGHPRSGRNSLSAT